MRTEAIFAACVMFLAASPGMVRGQEEVIQPVNLMESTAGWAPRADGGNPPAVLSEPSIQIAGQPAVRLSYRDAPPHWGNVEHSITLQPTTRGIRFRFYKHSSDPTAALHVWLFEKDGDAWLQGLLAGGKIVGEAAEGWHDAEVAVGGFQYQPRGNGKREMASVEKILIGCNYGDMDVSFTHARPVLAGETPGESPAVLPPPVPVEGEKGRVVILSENFVIRPVDDWDPYADEDEETPLDGEVSPSASDPEWLAELAGRAGYGVTAVSASELASPGYLSANNFDVLIVPSAPYYPLAAGKAIQEFLAAGGSLFTTGGYAFDKPCVRAGESWHTVEQSLTVEQVDQGLRVQGLNHRHGIPADGQGPAPEQIPLFDPANPLKNTAYAESLVSFIPRVQLDGPFEGWAASALLGSNSPVFPKAYARRIPLLMGHDAIGRPTGALGQIVHNHDGPYRGSSWAAFGVTNVDLFSMTGTLSLEFGDILDRIAQKVFIHSLSTDLFLYKPGETATLTVRCANYRKEPSKVWVRFQIISREGIPVSQLEPVERELAPESEERIESIWTVPPAPGADFYIVRCEMTFESRDDTLETAFCVDAPARRERGLAMTFRDNYFGRAGEPTFLLGTNQTGAVFSSAFEDPLVWDRDLKSMRSHGLSIVRVLHFSPYVVSTNGEPRAQPLDLAVENLPQWLERKLDALVQLCAENEIVLLLTLHDWMSVALTDEELAAQKKFARLVASRYARCPHVMFDVQNEPSVELSREKTDFALWNSYLLEKYGAQEALAAAWGGFLNGERAGAVSLEPGPEQWENSRRVDRDLFRVWLQRRWVKANISGIKESSSALATVGYIQWMHLADQLMAMQDQDFANKHYYGAKSNLSREFKVIDRRFEGKSLSLGEFGSVEDHEARIRGRTRAEADFEWYFEALSTVLTLGGSFALNWCWKEMPDNVFPWGINSPNDEIPRETLLTFRAFALATRDFQPRYESPAAYVVAPDLARMGFGGEAATGALYRAIDAMLAQRVEFGVINEDALEALPDTARVLFLPCPYVLGDDAYQVLREFVDGGGTLYVSGDVCYGPDRRRDRPNRLSELFGLEVAGTIRTPMTALRFEDGSLLPAVEVKAGSAGALEGTEAWVNAFGKGKAIFSPAPHELATEPVELYRAVLDLAGIQPFAADPPDRRVALYRVAGSGEGDEAVFVNNRTESVQEIMLGGGTQIRLSAAQKALVIQKAGKPASLIVSGPVALNGKPWAEFGCLTAAISLDGLPLSETRQLALVPLGAGEVRLHSPSLQQPVLWAGEVRDAEWRTLAVRAPQQTAGMLILPAETPLRFSVLLLAAKGDLEKASQAAAARIAMVRPSASASSR